MERKRTETTRAPGRPRSREAHEAILRTAIALIREVGYDALTMDAIAARAGVGKATVYRRWKSREALVVEAIGQIVAAASDPDTGSAEDDLMRLMRSTLAMYADPASAALLSGLVAAMARSEPIAHAVRTGFVGMRRAAMRRALERGIARGELRPETDVELALDLMSGPLFWRFLVTGGPVDEALAHGAVHAVLRAFAPDETTSSTDDTEGRAP